MGAIHHDIDYKWEGDYLIPDLGEDTTTPEPLTKWGILRKDYLKNYRKTLYSQLSLMGELFPHCLEVQKQAEERYTNMMARLRKKDPPPSNAVDYLGHVQHLTGHQQQVEEIILAELIHE